MVYGRLCKISMGKKDQIKGRMIRDVSSNTDSLSGTG